MAAEHGGSGPRVGGKKGKRTRFSGRPRGGGLRLVRVETGPCDRPSARVGYHQPPVIDPNRKTARDVDEHLGVLAERFCKILESTAVMGSAPATKPQSFSTLTTIPPALQGSAGNDRARHARAAAWKLGHFRSKTGRDRGCDLASDSHPCRRRARTGGAGLRGCRSHSAATVVAADQLRSATYWFRRQGQGRAAAVTASISRSRRDRSNGGRINWQPGNLCRTCGSALRRGWGRSDAGIKPVPINRRFAAKLRHFGFIHGPPPGACRRR